MSRTRSFPSYCGNSRPFSAGARGTRLRQGSRNNHRESMVQSFLSAPESHVFNSQYLQSERSPKPGERVQFKGCRKGCRNFRGVSGSYQASETAQRYIQLLCASSGARNLFLHCVTPWRLHKGEQEVLSGLWGTVGVDTIHSITPPPPVQDRPIFRRPVVWKLKIKLQWERDSKGLTESYSSWSLYGGGEMSPRDLGVWLFWEV